MLTDVGRRNGHFLPHGQGLHLDLARSVQGLGVSAPLAVYRQLLISQAESLSNTIH